MQAEITFSETAIRTKTAGRMKMFRIIKPIKEFQKFIEEGDWDEHLSGYEKYINRFSWGIIIASVIFFTPVCISILFH
jgi:hypothetical protein